MKCIAVLVEGQTEEQFVKKVLFNYLGTKEIFIEPVILKTKVTPQKSYKGGRISLEKAVKEIKKMLTPKYDIVTTFLDFYGLEKSFIPDNISSNMPVYEKVQAVEDNFYKKINNNKFLPYIQIHEFETFLFINPKITAENLLNCNKEEIETEINDTLEKYNCNPELINDSVLTSPSKRIMSMYPRYQKQLSGAFICSALGIENIRKSCRHFSEWINKLENL